MTEIEVPDLLLYCPSSLGGIPDYAHHQAEALAKRGLSVLMLCPVDYPHQSISYQQDRCLSSGENRPSSKPQRVVSLVWEMLRGYAILAKKIKELRCRRVLLASYQEYLAPFWAWRLRRLRRSGVRFGAVIHDPVRDFLLGPKLWHRWSVSEGYSFLDEGFIHEEIELDTGLREYPISQNVVPHGPYHFPDAIRSPKEVREDLDIPQGAKLFLSFGHLRDGKNLALVLEAMTGNPDVFVMIVGTEAGTGHIPSAEYQKMAEKLGVASRCRWEIGFASPERVAEFFEASDFVLLTYDVRFRSASGVLNVAARYRRPVVASCGKGNLATAVQRYQLGPWVEPDRADEIARGIREVLSQDPSPRWDQYLSENSWEKNAKLVMKAMKIESRNPIESEPHQK